MYRGEVQEKMKTSYLLRTVVDAMQSNSLSLALANL